MGAAAFQDFDAIDVDVGETRIFLRRSGAGPAVLLLHGFPQTHLMWRRVAPLLARRFTVVCPDLRGYGRSGCPASRADHAPYAKRAMANDMVFAMEKLGFARFSVAGHDRGGRVAYRLALDHPERVERLAVLDVLSTADAWERADKRLATAFWPWSLLAQPEPLPERLVSSAPDAFAETADARRADLRRHASRHQPGQTAAGNGGSARDLCGDEIRRRGDVHRERQRDLRQQIGRRTQN